MCDTTIADSVFIPNVISPNGDFMNDQFIIKNLPEVFHLNIFNRWGRKIFETSDRNKMWPEPKGGNKPEDGTYFYLLDMLFPSGMRHYHGNITVFGG
jgi:gliding motility-associated-like protein